MTTSQGGTLDQPYRASKAATAKIAKNDGRRRARSTLSHDLVPLWILLRAMKMSLFLRHRYTEDRTVNATKTRRKSHPLRHRIPAGRNRTIPGNSKNPAPEIMARGSTRSRKCGGFIQHCCFCFFG